MPIALQDSRLKVTTIDEFSGGLNNRFSQDKIENSQTARVRNCRWREKGTLSKREGSATISSVNITTGHGFITGLHPYLIGSMTAEALLVATQITVAGNSLFKATGDPPGSFTSLGTSLANNFGGPEFVTFNNKVYIADGLVTLKSWDDTTIASIAGSPISRFIKVFKNYLFHFNLSANTSILQWSDRNAPETYTDTNKEFVSINDGAIGVGMEPFGDELILAKGPISTLQGFENGSLWRVIGDIFDANNPSYIIDRIPLEKGAIPLSQLTHRTMRSFKGVLIFLTTNGWYAYPGGGAQPYRISETMQGDIDDLTFQIGGNAQAAAIVYKNYYLCSALITPLDSGISVNRVYVYDGERWFVDILSNTTDDFTSLSGTPTAWTLYRSNNLYSSTTENPGNLLRRWFNGTFTDGSTNGVNASYLTKEIDFGQEQKFLMLYVTMKKQTTNSLTLEYNIDQSGVISNTISMTAPDSDDIAPSSTSIIRKKIIINKTGRTFQLRFHNRDAVDFEISRIELYHHNARGSVN